MRSMAYGAAILAALGIMTYLALTPSDSPVIDPDAVATSSSTPDVELASLTMDVPKMHCPSFCYPKVKETLESREDVIAVELAPQKEEGVIDNRQVIVSIKDGFDGDAAIAMLQEAGFGGASVAEK
ncbi:MAG: heavy-metal-associated domain-containing protein [Planctomycetota bacterium]